MLEIRLLGQFGIWKDGERRKLPSRQAQALLAYLLFSPGVQHRREKLSGQLWPDLDETKARGKLRYALWQLRQAVGNRYLQVDRISIAFDPASDYWLDVAAIGQEQSESLTTDELQSALASYKGDLLPGFYEEWVLLERERLQASYERKMALLLQRLLPMKRWPEVLEWAERWIALGQAPESAFRALMIAHSQLGDSSSAASTYARCAKILQDELGVEPSEETQAVYELILRGEKPPASLFAVIDADQEIRPGPATIPPVPMAEESRLDFESDNFVARDRELNLMDEKLQTVLAGQGGLIFIAGDAGRGKTALLEEFTRRAQRRSDELVVAFGSGEAHTGRGDPHLPFRDILSLLTGDVESRWHRWPISQTNARRLWEMVPRSVQALLRHGPDLIGDFVPGEALWQRASSYAPAGARWLDQLKAHLERVRSRPAPINVEHADQQKHLFDQFTECVQELARQRPLLLVLDDLQWADQGSISLLFHLGRRIKGHRVMVAGAYRLDEIAPSYERKAHPLMQLLVEFKRIFGEIEINLDRVDESEGRQFVNAILDTEPNRLSEEFREALYQHTGGHPLFTIELLRQMKTEGDLYQDGQGRWTVRPAIGWNTLPPRAEAVIEGRVGRLPANLRDILQVACIEGKEFTAEVVARTIGLDIQETITGLSRELDRQHHLVEAKGIEWAGQDRLSLYRFRHHLFQKYLYDSMDWVERAHLHQKVGETLEKLHAGQEETVAVRLARHFELAGAAEKAIDYLLRAGDTAKRQSANLEAINHYNSGLMMLGNLQDASLRDQKELLLQISLGAPLVATRGWAAPEVERTYERARQLCQTTGETRRLAPVLWGLWSYYLVRGKPAVALKQAEQILAIAQAEEEPAVSLVGNWTLGITLAHLGQFSPARTHLERAIQLYDREKHSPLTYQYGQDPGVTCLIYQAFALWYLGYPDQALEKSRHAVSLAGEISHLFSRSFAHAMVATFHAIRREPGLAAASAKQAIDLAGEGQFPFIFALGLCVRGWAQAETGKPARGARLVRRGLAAMDTIGAQLGRPLMLALLAETLGKAKEVDEGLVVVTEALDLVRKNEERMSEAELYRLRGMLLGLGGANVSELFSDYQKAIEVAGQQGARIFELRAATGLADLRGEAGRAAEERKRLSEIYGRFTEGFDTADLKEARHVLKAEGSGLQQPPDR